MQEVKIGIAIGKLQRVNRRHESRLSLLLGLSLWSAYHAPGMTALKHPFFGCPTFLSIRSLNAGYQPLSIRS